MSIDWELGDEKGWRLNAYVCIYVSDYHNQNNPIQAILIVATLLKLIVADE
jgi:hypothetical protein